MGTTTTMPLFPCDICFICSDPLPPPIAVLFTIMIPKIHTSSPKHSEPLASFRFHLFCVFYIVIDQINVKKNGKKREEKKGSSPSIGQLSTMSNTIHTPSKPKVILPAVCEIVSWFLNSTCRFLSLLT